MILTKEQIRSKILLKLKTQKEENRDRKSKIIEEKLFRTKVFKKAKMAMFYLSYTGEVQTEGMIKKALQRGKIVVVPVCNRKKKTITPCRIGLNSRFRRGLYGILEPVNKCRIPLRKIDLVIVPAVAFDKRGNRLGRGKGYYDRFLKSVPKDTPRIGLAFDFQILPSLPIKPHDISVDKTIFA
jgi:5-formyltetrahydrofolate cyclo-ligase